MTTDWSAVRREFPSLEHWTYLNTATYGQLPQRAVDAVAAHFEHRVELACADFLTWFDDADRIRHRVAELIHATADDIAFIPTASTGLSLLLGGIDWKAGDRIVTLKNEFPNNLYHPAVLGNAGVALEEVEWDEFYQAAASARLVAISTVNYTNGFRPPLQEIGAFLRERNVLFYLDGTQSIGALEFDAAAIQPDFLAVDAYKWLLTPNGGGFLYVAPRVREWLRPNIIGWRSHRTWREVDHLHHGAPEFSASAEKYEGGMLPFPALYGMGASIDMMLELGTRAIEQRVSQLAGELRVRLRKLGARLIFDEAPHFDSQIVSAQFEGRDASQLARELKSRRVVVSARHGNLRISTHFYNNEQDLDRLAAEVEALLSGTTSRASDRTA